MLKAGNRCKLYLFEEYIHGYLNLDNRYGGIDEYRKANDLTMAVFR